MLIYSQGLERLKDLIKVGMCRLGLAFMSALGMIHERSYVAVHYQVHHGTTPQSVFS